MSHVTRISAARLHPGVAQETKSGHATNMNEAWHTHDVSCHTYE